MYKTKARTLQDKKKAMREELNTVNKGRETLRAKLRDLKGKVGANATIQKIEEKVAALDYRITHHTLDLKEENRVCCLGKARSEPASAHCNPLCNILASASLGFCKLCIECAGKIHVQIIRYNIPWIPRFRNASHNALWLPDTCVHAAEQDAHTPACQACPSDPAPDPFVPADAR